MSDSPEAIRKHLVSYWIVGGALFVFTVITWAVAEFLDLGAPGLDVIDVILGLSIASFKGALVMLIFMHLNHERGLIYQILFFTVMFFLSLFLLTLFAECDHARNALKSIP